LPFEALSEFIVTGEGACFLNEVVQLFIPINERNHCATNVLVDTVKEVDMDPTEISLYSKLGDKKLELITELAGGVSVLMYGLNVSDDIGFAIGGLVMSLECFEELFKGWESFDIFIGIDIPDLRFSTEHGSSETSLGLLIDLRELHVLFYAESLGCNGHKREIGTVKFIGFRNLGFLRHVP